MKANQLKAGAALSYMSMGLGYILLFAAFLGLINISFKTK